MNNKAKKIRNILLGISIPVIAVVAVVIIFISPITKYLIQKYDVKYLGREITLDWIYVNPFTGYAHIHNLKVYEAGGMDSVFLSASGASVNFAMLKMLNKTYEIENVTLTHPRIKIIQDHNVLNFTDIIERFAPKKDSTVKKAPSEPVHFNILDIKVEDGEFYYQERSIPVNYYIKKVNIVSSGKRWDVDSMPIAISFQSGPAPGDIKGKMTIDFRTQEYTCSAQIHKYDLKFLEQYMRDFSNYGSFTASVDADVQAKGNFAIKLGVDAKGWLAVNDFHFGKVAGEDYLSFDKLSLSLIDVNPRQYSYYIDTIMLDKPFFKYERYDHLDNVSALFGKNMQNIKNVQADSTKFNLVIEIGKYVNDIVKNFLKSYYKINKVAIYKGNILFNDFSLREQFSIAADPLTIIADSIDKQHKRMNVNMTTGLKPYGDINVSLSLDPNNHGTFDVRYKINKIPASLFNPYLITYTSFPLDRGSIDFNGELHVLDGNIRSNNHLLILDPRVGKRVKHRDTKWIPMPLIMSIVRESSGAIDYEIPIAGSLKDPKFKLRYVILDILANIFVKPPSSPYLFHVKDVENSVEKFQTLKWETRKSNLRERQEIYIQMIARFLSESKEASITVSPMEYTDKEKEYILFFEAKRKYRLRNTTNKRISEKDSIDIDKMSIKDSMFTVYLNKLVGDTPMFTVQEKCKYYIGEGIVTVMFNKLMADRQKAFMRFFGDDTKGRVHMATSRTIIPFSGFSYYKIEYKGEIPTMLQGAYDEINNINEDKPRRQYRKVRKENGGSVPEVKSEPRK